MNTAISTNTTITIADLVKAGGGTPDKAKPLVFNGDQFKAPGRWVSDPVGSKQEYSDVVDSMTEIIEHSETFQFGYNDVAVNLHRVMMQLEGGVVRSLKSKPGSPPAERTVDIGYDMDGVMQKVTIPSDWMTVPSATARVICQPNMDGTGSVYFQFPRVEHEVILGILSYLRAYIKDHSIYRGQCIDERYNYVNASNFDITKVVYNTDIEDLLNTFVLSPLRDGELREANGLNTKLSVCLKGRPGTGKTMFIRMAQSVNFALGGTTVSVSAGSGIDGIQRGVEIMRTYMAEGRPSLLTYEDIETLNSNQRSRLLELFDGAAGKNDRAVLITTTNFGDDLDPAMLRPGRIDFVIPVELPDREAFEKLVRMQLGDFLAEDVDFDAVFPAFDQYTSAWIVSSSQIVVAAHIARTRQSPDNGSITSRDLIAAANGYRPQFEMQLAATNRKPEEPVMDTLFRSYVIDAVNDVRENEQFATADETDYEQVYSVVDDVVENRINEATIKDDDGNRSRLYTR